MVSQGEYSCFVRQMYFLVVRCISVYSVSDQCRLEIVFSQCMLGYILLLCDAYVYLVWVR